MSEAKQARTPASIEAEIAASQQRVAYSVDQLVANLKPKAIVHRGVEVGKDKAHDQLYDEAGDLRTQRIITVVGAGVGVIAALVTLRILLNKKR